MTNEVIEGEIVSRELVAHEPAALFGTTEPTEVIAKAGAVANALKSVLKNQGLLSNIKGKEYVRVEGWTLLGTMLGVFPVNVWTREILQDGKPYGWEARVEARTMGGAVVGAAEAECTRGEKMWSDRDGYALRSMCQTRATSKALRMPLGFVVTLAGFEATPAEEMTFADRPVPAEAKPKCPKHGNSMKLIPGGVSKATGKDYTPFFTCQTKGCDQGNKGKGFYVDAQAFADSRGILESKSDDEAVDYDAVPYEE